MRLLHTRLSRSEAILMNLFVVHFVTKSVSVKVDFFFLVFGIKLKNTSLYRKLLTHLLLLLKISFFRLFLSFHSSVYTTARIWDMDTLFIIT